MNAAIDADSAVFNEEDFAKPCHVHKCEEVATWAGWASHGSRNCPGESFVCDKHKEEAIRWWEMVLRMESPRCARCRKPVPSNLLSDNLRFIPL